MSNLAGFTAVFAQDDSVLNQINQISQLDNKEQALAELAKLVQSSYIDEDYIASIEIARSKVLFALHQYDLGVEALTKAKKIAIDSVLIAQANKMLGVLFYYQGELQKSLKAYQDSLTFYHDNQTADVDFYSIEQANLLNNIALVYTSLGQHNLALNQYQLAEPLYAKYGDEVDRIDVRYNIAALHITLRRSDSAIDMLKVIIEKRQQFNDGHGVASARAHLGIAYKHAGQYELAKQNIQAALQYFQANDYKFDVASQLHNISEIYNESFDVEQAIFYGEQGLDISQEVGHQRAYAGCLQSLAKAYFYSGKVKKAQYYIQRSTAAANKINYQHVLNENLAISALIHASNQQFVTALAEQNKYEKSYLLAENTALNEQLAEFESKQLNQQIEVLEQQGNLQRLESAKIAQQRNVIILSLIFILVVAFFIYRHYLEKKLTHELELRVKQRTRELEQLSEELSKANQVKSQFLANMSHEIRTPLTAIVGHSESIIYDDVDEDKVKDDIEVIHGNSLHLLELINDILDLSRIEANKLELEMKPLNLADLIQYLSDIFENQAQQKRLRFFIEHQIALPCIIQVDALRLKQILLNLCANAIKFTEQGHVTLTIRWHNEQLEFTVTDTGIGLSKVHLAQVFELFTQADNSISRRFGGSGLGLSLSNQLAKLMSGKIIAQSTLGKGSTFCFSLPCKRCDSNIVATAPLDLATVDDDVALFSGTVLLAEDHDDNRRLIARLLSRLGLDVIVASNGKEAVKLCMEHQPNLVLLDIQMPEMDGVEAFRKLRSLGCHQPIFALTANAMAHEVSQYLDIGFTGHLKKPIERKNFVATIAKYFPAMNDVTPSDTDLKAIASSNELQNERVKQAEQSLDKVDFSDLIIEFKASLAHDKQALIRSNNDRQLKQLATLAHRLSGAAQMFGFSELNQAAKKLETILKKELSSEQPNFKLISELTHCLIDEINLTVQ